MIKIANDILKGSQNSLLTQQLSEDTYRSLLYETPKASMSYDPYYKVVFNYPQPSTKVKYAQSLINHGFTAELDTLIAETRDPKPTTERVLYKLMKIDRAIKPLLTSIQAVIDENQYDLSLLSNPNTRFSDIQYFSNVYICYYLRACIIHFVIEFQAQFADYIPEQKRLSIEKIYNEYLLMQVPQEKFIDEVRKLTILPEQADSAPVETLPTNVQIFLDEVNKYAFTELPKLKALTQRQVLILLTKMLAKQTPYIIAMLSFLEYDSHLKHRYRMTKENIYKHVSEALNNIGPRQIKGNFLVLNESSKEDVERYTSYQFKDEVIKDYENTKVTN